MGARRGNILRAFLDFVGGTVAITGASGLTIGGSGALGSLVALNAGSTLEVTNTATVQSGANLVIDGGTLNAGTLAVQAGGRVSLRSGTCRIIGAGTVANSGVLTGDGIVTAALTNNASGELRAENRHHPGAHRCQRCQEYACNMDPRVPDAATLTSGGTTGLPALRQTPDGHLQVTFLRRTAVSLPTVTQGVVFSNDLRGWNAEPTAAVSIEAIDSLWDRVTLTDPTAPAARRFARTAVTTP